jgi:UDP-N-acetylglucosamine acyltransferase
VATRIHPTAIVEPGAELGDGVEIGPYAYIHDKVLIGEGSRVDAYAQIYSYTTLGKNNRVFSYAAVGGEPQDLKYHGEVTQLVIGDNNSIREYATIHRGTEGGGGITRIGSGCLLMAYVHVAHDCILGDGVILSNCAMLAGHVLVGDYGVIGGMSGVHQFVRLGEYSFLGAYSGLGQDLPPYMLAAGSRAKMHGPNVIGLRRRSKNAELLPALRAAYKKIFRSDMPRKEALEDVEREYAQFEEIQFFVQFIRSSQRGIVSPNLKSEDADD